MITADELGLFTTLGPTIEVFNCTDTATDAANIMAGLADGEEHLFPPHLTDAQRRVVHTVATDANLLHATVNTKEGTHVCIGNKQTYQEQVRMELTSLQPGDEKTYPVSLTPLERSIVQIEAEAAGCRSKVLNSMQGQYVHVTCAPRRGSAVEDSEEKRARFREEQAEVMLQRVFAHYASKGELFRFADLRLFVEDVVPLHRGSVSKKVLSRLDDVYDDTRQLQQDMGFRAKGLNRKFFRVFLEKSAATLTWTLVSMLSALFDKLNGGGSSTHSK
eukprot:NODE_5852_length_1728_cov_10.742661.p1 GENE.NODE_5852_length_1728_cov_10.742661~~NODE_5852_length_1728_cov_10.742661.p1  ORF type:complete len:275 (+),score=59.57 NODE_5852_length_1728_cov_10.742661:716-1540(+)